MFFLGIGSTLRTTRNIFLGVLAAVGAVLCVRAVRRGCAGGCCNCRRWRPCARFLRATGYDAFDAFSVLVTVHSARDIVRKDKLTGGANLTCTVGIGHAKYSTPPAARPRWEVSSKLAFPQGAEALTVSVFAQRTVGKDQLLGRAVLDLETEVLPPHCRFFDRRQTLVLRKNGNVAGEVHMTMKKLGTPALGGAAPDGTAVADRLESGEGDPLLADGTPAGGASARSLAGGGALSAAATARRGGGAAAGAAYGSTEEARDADGWLRLLDDEGPAMSELRAAATRLKLEPRNPVAMTELPTRLALLSEVLRGKAKLCSAQTGKEEGKNSSVFVCVRSCFDSDAGHSARGSARQRRPQDRRLYLLWFESERDSLRQNWSELLIGSIKGKNITSIHRHAKKPAQFWVRWKRDGETEQQGFATVRRPREVWVEFLRLLMEQVRLDQKRTKLADEGARQLHRVKERAFEFVRDRGVPQSAADWGQWRIEMQEHGPPEVVGSVEEELRAYLRGKGLVTA